MKVIHSEPKIFEKIKAVFPVDWESGVIVTYGDNVYCSQDISPDLEIHEGIHIEQQSKMDKDEWWDKYLTDKSFRLSQEIEAYRRQFDWIKKNIKDKNTAFRIMKFHLDNLCSPMYGSIITTGEAIKLLGGLKM